MKFSLAALEAETLGAGVVRQRVQGERLEFILYRYAPGAVFPRHRHAAEQLTIVLSGELVFCFDDGEVRLQAGDALLIAGNRPHSASVPEDAGETRSYNLFSPVRATPPNIQ